jgi:IS605 OrfB family transposase
MKKKKRDHELRTLSIKASFSKEQMKIFRFLTNESKKIYNHYMFCLNIYNYYKEQLYEDVFLMHLNNSLTNENINDKIVERIKYYYAFYTNNYIQYKINNNVIYKIIKDMKLIITDENYDEAYSTIINKCYLDKNIIFNASNAHFLFYDIIKNILTSFYIRNFYNVRNSLIYKKPIPEHLQIDNFIKHVKKQKLKYKNSNIITPLYYKALSKCYNDINSEQTIIRKFALEKLENNKMYRDTVINIMDNAYKSYKSYLELKFAGKYANKPKYKLENEKYILPLYASSFTKINNECRICLGDYVDKHYNEICNTNYKIIKSLQTYTLYEITNEETFKGSFTFINLPKQLENKKLTLIIIKPLYDGHKFDINYTYQQQPKNREYIIDNNISIDLGMGNLMTIYDPNGEQILIKGKKIIQMNEKFNNIIAYQQSNMNKCNHYTSKKIRNIFIKRDNKIDYCFNQITKKIYELYKTKDKIIIGYNKSWKTNINIGKNNNRKFYQIPFTKLIKKLRDKFGKNLIEIGEAYTSKTDSLAKEDICKQENYLGKRIKRGLFSSSTRKLINADLNGAINIMRLYEKKYNNKDLEQITGLNIYNPKVINAYEV